MRAIRVHEVGGPEVLRLEELPVPEPGPGEVLVRLLAIGVNFIDTYKRKGLYPVPTPFTLGEEGAGVVEKVGEGVVGVRPGDRVAFANVQGAYAEYLVVPAASAAGGRGAGPLPTPGAANAAPMGWIAYALPAR